MFKATEKGVVKEGREWILGEEDYETILSIMDRSKIRVAVKKIEGVWVQTAQNPFE